MTTSKKDAAELEFPSAVGQDEVEIAKRTVNNEKLSDTVFRKEFVVGIQGLSKDDPMHENNKRSVLTDAINQGLHPRGDVELVSSTDLEDGHYSSHWYNVDVIPSHVDHEAWATSTPRLPHGAPEGKSE